MTGTLRGRVSAAVRSTVRDEHRTDAELVAAFVGTRDQAAFAALVTRHGPLVLGVCRRALGATADAEDAFQATFLVLVTKAGAIPWRGSLGPWLFGVAHRVARKARFKRDRRFAVEKQVDAMPHPESTDRDPAESDELGRLFDEELAALPEEMRRAVVLCELQGRSRAAAAKELGVSEGTLSSRLGRARKRLRDRLANRGVALAVPPAVVVSARLSVATAGLANGSVGAVPAAVWELAQEALKAMTITKLKVGAVLVAAVIGLTGFGLSASGIGGDEKPAAKAEPTAKPKAEAPPTKAGPVATVNGIDISREEFGEYLIRKYGAKEIDLFVNKKVIQLAAGDKGVTVTGEEVEEEFAREAKSVGVTTEDFAKSVLAKHGKTEAEWREDGVLPRLLMQKLCEKEVAVTDADLRAAFARKFGERRKAQLTAWSKDRGEALPGPYMVPRVVPDESPGMKAFVAAAFALKKEGDVSDRIVSPEGDFKVRLIEIIPPNTDAKFEDEKEAIRAELLRHRLEAAVPPAFAKLREQAKPIFHIQPDPKK